MRLLKNETIMNICNSSFQFFRNMSITSKFSLGIGLLLSLILMVAATGYLSTEYVDSAQESIQISREIQQLVLEMDRGMEKARRFHADFYLQYPQIGLARAHEQYAQPSVRQIAQVISISDRLKRLISLSEVSKTLRKGNVDLNLYLSSAKRFADTSIKSVELVTELAAPDRGLEAQLDGHLIALQVELAGTEKLDLLYRKMRSFVQDYRISRKRFLMQSAFNIAFSLRREITQTPGFDSDQRKRVNVLLDQFNSVAEKILAVDSAIKSKFKDFALQAAAVGPISATLANLAKQEVERSRAEIIHARKVAEIAMASITVAGLLVAAGIAMMLNSSITRRVVRLTAATAQLRTGHLDVFACDEGKDELSQLAHTFNVMAARIKDLIDGLEQRVNRATEALRKSEERLRLAQDAAKVGTWEWDPQSNAMFWSGELWNFWNLGSDGQGPSHRAWIRMVHPEDRPAVERTMKEAERDGTGLDGEWRVRDSRGTERWIMVRGQPVGDVDSQSMRYFGIVMDITDRKHMEEILKESQQRMMDILNFLPDPTLAIDNERRIIIWNRAIEEMTGVPASEMIGQGDYAYTVPFYGERRPQLMDLIWEASGETTSKYPRIEQEGHSFVAEVFCPALYGGKGAWVFAKASPLHDRDGNVIGAIESVRDITDRRRTEEALEKRLVALTLPLDEVQGIGFQELFNLDEIQALQDQFAQAAGVASIITDTDGTPITKPSNFCRLCQDIIRQTEKGLKNCYYSDSVIGRYNPQGPIVQPCLSGGLWDAGASISVGGRHIANWLIGQVRDETQNEAGMREYAREISVDEQTFVEAFFEVPAMPRDQFEKIAQALFTLAQQLSSTAYQNIQQARFITQLKQAEEEKEKLQAQFLQAQKMESVGRLAGGVAHDFNNMLQAILGYTGMALVEASQASPLQSYLLEIEKAAKRSAELVRQLLSFARKQVVSPKVLDLNHAISGLIKMLQRLIGEDIDLAWLPGHGLWPIKIDPSQIQQLLANLAVNARDAIAGVGQITIETGNVALDETYCKTHMEVVPGEYVMLAVSDNGCGMDAETLEHIFEPFFTTKGVGEGTGLGLATVYGIVKQNNGFINVYSEPGAGTSVKLYLPRVEERAVQAEVESETAAVGGEETVLVVEDEQSILALCRTLLERLGYTVLTAQRPSQAIELAREYKGRMHLLITDVVMPEMNGRELARQILEAHPGLKCLFMSGYTANVIAHRTVLDKGVHFIQKPFSLKSIAEKVREVLDG